MSSSKSASKTGETSNFIRTIIDGDLASGKHTGVVTRFPPEPNGFLHVGHAKSICLNFGLALSYEGRCHLRFDDTNPVTEDVRYVEAMQRDVRWLGFDWGENLFHASDYFEQLHDYAIQLIKKGKAYVCFLSEAEFRTVRGTVLEAGTHSPYRDTGVDENLALFERMKNGEYDEGACVLRAKINMTNPNMKMRDPPMYRIKKAHHYRAGDNWSIYPIYDFAHCLSDSIEGITHSICTLEFENNRELYDWYIDELGLDCHPQQIELARLNLSYTITSKRKLLQLVEDKHVSGWDDPRMPTIAGMRRRGYTAAALRHFCERIGVSKANSVVDMTLLEGAVRDDLNASAPRIMGVLDPLKVVIENYPEGEVEYFEARSYPQDSSRDESRKIPFSREIYIERDDFMESPPKKFFRLAPGREVRLKNAYFLRCNQVIKDESGVIKELRCTYDPETKGGTAPDGRKVKGTLHWVSAAHAFEAEVRLYDRLLQYPTPESENWLDDVNPNSLHILKGAKLEPSAKDAAPGQHFQFERVGFFYADAEDSQAGRPVFNRVVTLKDTWAKVSDTKAKAEDKPAKKSVVKQPQVQVDKVAAANLDEAAQGRFDDLVNRVGLSRDDALILVENQALFAFFDAAHGHHGNAKGLVNWINNELLGALKGGPVASLKFGPEALAELVALIDDETLSSKMAKKVFEILFKKGGSAKAIVEEKGLSQISDPAVLGAMIDEIMAKNPDNVAKLKAGNDRVKGFFVGQLMKASGGKANPKVANRILAEKLAQ